MRACALRVCVCVYIYSMYVRTCGCGLLRIHKCVCVLVYICVHVCVSLCVCVCLCVNLPHAQHQKLHMSAYNPVEGHSYVRQGSTTELFLTRSRSLRRLEYSAGRFRSDIFVNYTYNTRLDLIKGVCLTNRRVTSDKVMINVMY